MDRDIKQKLYASLISNNDSVAETKLRNAVVSYIESLEKRIAKLEKKLESEINGRIAASYANDRP